MITERTRLPPRYRLLEEVGQGGMAIVYRARDESLRRDVALKVLHPHLSAEPESKARLEREAQAVAKLKHDNILEIFDYSGQTADSAYIVTEFIDGQTLKQFLSGRTVTHPELAALVGVELGGALAHAHGLGIIHRDIKPENVMIRKDGLLKLMDFGIAQVLDLERMTVTGQLLGSPAYMAPELIEGRRLDVRTDVFSMGILLYQMATGSLPFSGKNPHEILRRISEGKFPDPRNLNPRCGATLHRIFSRALAREPANRYPQMVDLVNDLREHLAEAGLTNARAELRGYFQNPTAYEEGLPARMTPALTATAQSHLEARATGKAIECWNRVLAYAPNDQMVSAALKGLERHNRRRRFGRYALGVGGAVALTGAVAAAVIRSAGSDPQQPNLARTTEPTIARPAAAPPANPERPAAPAAPPPADQVVAASEARPAVARPARPRPGAGMARPEGATGTDTQPGAMQPPPSQTTPRVFALGPTPQNVDVYLDGERQFSYDTDHRTLTVPWESNHTIEFRSPSGCCFVERIEVGPDRPLPPENIIARKLKWKPARLVVTIATEGQQKAKVMVRDPGHPGRGTVVETGEEANIPFFVTDEGQKEIEVSADSAAGFAAERVTVRAGERKSVVLNLAASP